MKDIYNELYDKVSKYVLNYRDDLEVHDKGSIQGNPGVKFLHWTRENRTHLVLLHDATKYPKKGERIPYLFGTADREHILDEVYNQANHHFRSEQTLITHYFDGRELHRISAVAALEIAKKHIREIKEIWLREGMTKPVSRWGVD